ncbi:MAG: hypothetical protein M3Q50_15530 [Chloroflexota bacterium]|nr:hypothetical protein [Chloroflexota bacterium]
MPRQNRYRFPLAIAALLLALSASNSGGQPATPAVYPVAPAPSECVIASVPLEEIVAIRETPVPDAAAIPAPFTIPAGRPADTETTVDVIATLRQVFACANVGDPLRCASLYSDDFLRSFFGGVPRDDVIAFLSLPPQFFPEDQKRVIIRFGKVQLLSDGRAGVIIVLDEPDDPRREEPDYAILERIDGRWLVDEIHEDGGAIATTPAP